MPEIFLVQFVSAFFIRSCFSYRTRCIVPLSFVALSTASIDITLAVNGLHSLGSNNIGYPGAKDVAEALKVNKTLTKLE